MPYLHEPGIALRRCIDPAHEGIAASDDDLAEHRCSEGLVGERERDKLEGRSHGHCVSRLRR